MSEARGWRRNPRHSRAVTGLPHSMRALHNSESREIHSANHTHTQCTCHSQVYWQSPHGQSSDASLYVHSITASAVGYIARFCCCGHTMDSSQAPADRKRYPHTTPRPPTSRAQLSGRRLPLGLAHFIFAAALSIIARFISSSSCTSSFILRADRNTTEPPWPICAGAEPPLG